VQTNEHGPFVIKITRPNASYNAGMQRKIFWMSFTLFGLLADFMLPFWWAVGATLPLMCLSWWIAYRSDWF